MKTRSVCPHKHTFILIFLTAFAVLLPTASHAAIYSLGSSALVEGPAAGDDSVILTVTPASGTWTAAPNTPWLHVAAASSSGAGSANVYFSFDANSGATRTGTFTIAGQTLTITQAGSTYVAARPLTTLVRAVLNDPHGVAVDGSGNVYTADTLNEAIKEYSTATQTVNSLSPRA